MSSRCWIFCVRIIVCQFTFTVFKFQTYLKNMKKGDVVPNLETFHSVLRAMKSTPDEKLKDKVPEVLAEMRELEIGD